MIQNAQKFCVVLMVNILEIIILSICQENVQLIHYNQLNQLKHHI